MKTWSAVGLSRVSLFCLCFFRWSWPGRTRGCGNRHHIWCSRRTAWQELGRWRGLFSSPLYPSRTPPAYPQGSLFPHQASCLQAAGVCSLWKQNGGMTLLHNKVTELNDLFYKFKIINVILNIIIFYIILNQNKHAFYSFKLKGKLTQKWKWPHDLLTLKPS